VSIKDEIAADAVGILSEIGEPVIWSGQLFNAIISRVELSDALQIGGFDQEYDFTVKILKWAFGPVRPKLNDPVQFDGDTYRIAKVSESPASPFVILTVQSK
jgi:hypothetical protein